MSDRVRLPYGRGFIEANLSAYKGCYTLLTKDEDDTPPEISRNDLIRSFDDPIDSLPLREVISPDDSLCIVTSDATRPSLPMRFMLHAVLEYLGRKPENTTIVTGSGSHRSHTAEELQEIFCGKILGEFTVVSHDSRADELMEVGRFSDGHPIKMNRHYVSGKKKIVLGCIEPHFFAGFSGGPKGIAPALCDIDTIRRLHSFEIIADSGSRYGNTDNNPSLDIIREATSAAPPDFLVNVVLDLRKKPVAAVSGDYLTAHAEGIRLSREHSMFPVSEKWPIVITTNGGHPADQNLYQTVKGIGAACNITEPGGTIIVVSECARGIPRGSNFERMLTSASSITEIIPRLIGELRDEDDRWQVQRLCDYLTHCRVILVSSLDEATTRGCLLGYAKSVDDAVRLAASGHPPHAAMAILPDGPLTIPVLHE